MAQMNSPKWEARSEAFYRLVSLGTPGGATSSPTAGVAAVLARHPQQADAVKAALIKTLEAENGAVRKGAPLSEEHSDYYGDLIMVVAGLDDRRSIGALAGALGTGAMASNALIAFGDAAVDAVVNRLASSTDRATRRSACRVLQGMVDPASRNPVKDPAHVRRIEQALAGQACSASEDPQRDK
jgi:hypothetical protein